MCTNLYSDSDRKHVTFKVVRTGTSNKYTGVKSNIGQKA